MFLLGIGLLSYTQTNKEVNYLDVYPVRVDHKWGYVRFYNYGEYFMFKDPKYDYISDVPLVWNVRTTPRDTSPYKLFEKDYKVGLLNESLDESISNKYRRIRPINHQFFAVETDSLFQLIDADEKPLWPNERYDDIFLADQNREGACFFFVLKNGRWGLRDTGGKEILSPQFIDIQLVGQWGYFKVRKSWREDEWFLINHKGEILVEDPEEDWQVFSNSWLGGKHKGFWHFFKKDKGKFTIERRAFLEMIKVNDQLVMCHSKPENEEEQVFLWNIQKRDTVATYFTDRIGNNSRPTKPFYPYIYDLDGQYLAKVNMLARGEETYQFLNINGSSVDASTYYQLILPSGKNGIYRIIRNGMWGIVNPSLKSEPLEPAYYSRIEAFEGNIAIVRVGKKQYGAIGMLNPDTIAITRCEYDRVFIEEINKVSLVKDNEVLVVGLNEEGTQLNPTFLINDGQVIDRDSDKEWREAIPIEKVAEKSDVPKTCKVVVNRFGEIFRVLPDTTQPTGQRRDWIANVPEEWNLTHYVDILPDMKLVRHIKEYPVFSKFSESLINNQLYLMDYVDLKYLRMANIFSCVASSVSPFFYEYAKPKMNKWSNEYGIIGMRKYDYRSSVTTYLTIDGKMGLMNAYGQPLVKDGKPILFSYIGPFRNGRARVALGGELYCEVPPKISREWKGETEKFAVQDNGKLIKEFLLDGPSNVMTVRAQNKMYIKNLPNDSLKWAYINTKGELLLETNYQHVKDFYDNNRALVLKQNKKTNINRLDADYGIMDESGELLSPIKYSDVIKYKDYFQVSVDSTPTFFFSKDGHQVFINRTRARPFIEGLSQFRNRDGKWGYINLKGEVVLEPLYAIARPFSEGLAMVVDSAGECVFINHDGDIKITTGIDGNSWERVGDFHDGRCWIVAKGSAWKCIDTSGSQVFKQLFFHYPAKKDTLGDVYNKLPMDFITGVANVKLLDVANNSFKSAIIDRKGDFIVEASSDIKISDFDDNGRCSYQMAGEKLFGLLDHSGKRLTPPTYKKIEGFVDGYARVLSKQGLWGIINLQGEEVIPSKYIELDTFSEGLVAYRMKKEAHWKFIDATGQSPFELPLISTSAFKNGIALVEVEYSYIVDGTTVKKARKTIIDMEGREMPLEEGEPIFFSEGLLGVEIKKGEEKKYYYADANGRNAFGRYFSFISPYNLGIATVRPYYEHARGTELLGAINKRGVMVVPPKFKRLFIQPDGNVIINPVKYYGLLSHDGDEILEPIYDRIDQYGEFNLFRVEQGEKVGYFRLVNNKANWVWDLQN